MCVFQTVLHQKIQALAKNLFNKKYPLTYIQTAYAKGFRDRIIGR